MKPNRRWLVMPAIAVLMVIALPHAAHGASAGNHWVVPWHNVVQYVAHDGEDNKLTVTQPSPTSLSFAERGALIIPATEVTLQPYQYVPSVSGLSCQHEVLRATCPALAPGGDNGTEVRISLGDGNDTAHIAGEFNSNVSIRVDCGPQWDRVVIDSASTKVTTTSDCTVVERP